MAAFPGLRPFVSGGQHTAIFKYPFADMRCLVGGVRDNGLCFWKGLGHTVIDFIKGRAVMYIAEGNDSLQNKSMFVTGRVGSIGKAFPMLSFYEQPAVRIGHALLYGAQLLLLPPDQLLLRDVVPALLCRGRKLVIVAKRFLSMGLPVRVDLFHGLLRINL